MMKKLISLAINRRVLIFVFFALLAAVGVYAWSKLSIDAYPDIADTTVQIVTQVPGLATEEIEQQISIPIERAMNGMPKLKVMRSKNTFGLSTILLVFEDGVDDYWARQRVQERLTGIELPYGADPGLNPLTSPTGEIFRYVVEGKGYDIKELTDIHKWTVIPYLKQVTGVADVSNFGGITTQYQIELDPVMMEQYGISLRDITEKVAENNINAGGSTFSQGDLTFVVRGVGLIKDLEDLGRIVISSRKGVPVFLKDLGTLKYGNLERKGILGFSDSERDYDESVEGIVQMLRGQNPSEVLADIHRAVADLNGGLLPEGVTLHPFMDRTNLVNTTLHTVAHTLLVGMALVVLVLLFFLRSVRGALVVAITIPLSLLIAFILMKITGIPANLLSLGAIDFGILVDGSIVMMETILRRREKYPLENMDKNKVIDHAGDVAKPIFFSTIIIITAYLPLFTFEHIESKLFTPMAYTVGYALVGALMTSLLLIPGLSYAAYFAPKKVRPARWLESLTESYHRTTARLLDHPKAVMAALMVILVGAGVMSYTVGKDFLPPLDEGSIWIQTQLPSGVSIQKAKEMEEEIRHTLSTFDEVSYVMCQLGRDDEGAECFSLSHIEIGVGLHPYQTWKSKRTKAELIHAMSEAIEKLPGFTVGFSQPIIDMVMDQIAGTHSDLALKVFSDDITEGRHVADGIARVLKSIPGATDVAVDQEPPTPQLQIKVDRQAIAQYGLNAGDVAELIELAIGGKAISQIFSGSKVYDVTCRYAEKFRSSPEAIGALMLMNEDGVRIPLSQVAEIQTTLGASTIMREMNRRNTVVRTNLRGTDLSTFLAEADKRIAAEVSFDPAKVHLQWAGQFENQNRAFKRLGIVIPLTLGIMLLLLVFACGKFRQALTLMSVIPLALFGGMAALNVRGMTFNVSSAVGFIALFGVAIQNGVLMISQINRMREKGFDLRESVLRGTKHRFRPILMTATVAILGLFPASISTGIGSDVQRPLATVIVYGLLCATAITLFILPNLYYQVEKKHEVQTNTTHE